MLRRSLLLAVAMAATEARAADKPGYGPPPAWVTPAAFDAAAPAAGSAPVRTLLADQQERLSREGVEAYSETVLKIQSPAGLQAVGTLSFTWNPDTDQVTVNKLRLIRDGKTIDLLQGSQGFTVLRRENNLERAMLDGQLTGVFQPPGLQVGDVIDFALTTRRADPILQGHVQGAVGNPRALPIDRLRLRAIWPSDLPVQWRADDGLPAAHVASGNGVKEVVIDAADVPALVRPKNAPGRFLTNSLLETADFASWPQVSALMAPLYDKAEALAADSPVRAEAAKIAAASPDPKVRAEAALRLVQDRVRYLFLGMDLGGYAPASADQTWSRLFGDCKGKTVLLLALLHQLGIQAEPAFVSTALGDGLDQRTPMLAFFDHAVVRAVIGGRVYWLDGTRTGDRDLDAVEPPPYEWALPIRTGGAALEAIAQPPLKTPLTETSLRLDASAGLDAPAPAHAEVVMRGDVATALKLALDGMAPEQRDQQLRDYWKQQYDSIEVKHAEAGFDESKGELRLSMDGVAKMDWGGAVRRYETDGTVLGWKADFTRDPGPHADAPYAIPYPSYDRMTETIVLPNHGQGFTTAGADVDETVGPYELKRVSKIQDGVATVTASSRTLGRELKADQAPTVQAELKRLSEIAVYVQAPADYAESEQQLAKAAEPTTAAEYEQRGRDHWQNGELDKALADFDRELQLDPKSVGGLIYRGALLIVLGRSDAALADLKRARDLDPQNPAALPYLAEAHIQRREWAEAEQLARQALALDPKILEAHLARAEALQGLGRTSEVEADVEAMIRLNPSYSPAYSTRGNLRLQAGRLDEAAADFDRAIQLDPKNADGFRGRGNVMGARGDYRQAIEAFSKAIELVPGSPQSLIPRSYAYMSLGDLDHAAADLDAATRLAPTWAAIPLARAQLLERKGDVTGALQALDQAQAQALSPKEPGPLIARAELLARHGRKAEALQALQAAIALKPTVQAYLLSAQYRPASDRAAALHDLQLAIALDPKAASPHLVQGRFQWSGGDRQAALASYDKAVELEPGDIQALSFRASAYIRLKRFSDGVRDLDAILAKDPHATGVLELKAYAEAMAGQEPESRRDLDAAIAQAPKDGVHLNARCWTLVTHGWKLDQALKDCDAAVAAQPTEGAFLDSRAMVQLRLGHYDKAIADYDRALALRPSMAGSLYGRGVAKLRSGDAKGGAADLASARAIDPGIDATFADYGVTPG